MYRELTASDLKNFLNVTQEYRVDALLTYGVYSKEKALKVFEKTLGELGIPCVYEPIKGAFFDGIKSINTPFGRLWFETIYGCAYASEIIHIASMLGAKGIIHLGSFGALRADIKTGDIIVPDNAYGDESVTRMYARKKTKPFFSANPQLAKELSENLGLDRNNDSVVSIQAMLAETREDVNKWSQHGYVGVEMECAALFSVADHFNVPAAAAIYAADNLIQNVLVTDEIYDETSENREAAKRRLFLAALKTLFVRMKG
jgi:purine-nucleoside phosphorylase